MKRMISVLVRNQPGVLMRVAGLISRRGYNIDTLAVGETENHLYSRISITLRADDGMTKQIIKQLTKLIEVTSVTELPLDETVVVGIALIKVKNVRQWELYKIADRYRAKVVDVTAEAVIFEITGEEYRIHSFLQRLTPYGILEMARTGMLGLQRGNQTIQDVKQSSFNTCLNHWEKPQFSEVVGGG